MSKAVILSAPGGVENLSVVDHDIETPGPGEVSIQHDVIGVNFIDIYHRTGLYPLPPPSIPGVEGSGRIIAVGKDVVGLKPGMRVAYAGAPGAYASVRNIAAWRAIPLQEEVDGEIAGAALLRGMTAHMLLHRTYPVSASDVVLVHAAAGGLGGILTSWATRLGARVIGTASNKEKADIAYGLGAETVVVGRDADIVAAIRDLTDGCGVDFVIDGIGGDMLAKSFDCTRKFGMVASIGQAAGTIPSLRVEELGPIRSIGLTRPSVMSYAAETNVYPDAVRETLTFLASDNSIGINNRYALAEAAQAQDDLERGRTTGIALLQP